MAKRILYIANGCHDCDKVEAYLLASGLEYPIVNVDEQELQTTVPLYAYPALCEGDHLLAYGVDIIRFIDRAKASSPQV